MRLIEWGSFREDDREKMLFSMFDFLISMILIEILEPPSKFWTSSMKKPVISTVSTPWANSGSQNSTPQIPNKLIKDLKFELLIFPHYFMFFQIKFCLIPNWTEVNSFVWQKNRTISDIKIELWLIIDDDINSLQLFVEKMRSSGVDLTLEGKKN